MEEALDLSFDRLLMMMMMMMMWHYGARRGRWLISELNLEASFRTLLTFYRRNVIYFI